MRLIVLAALAAVAALTLAGCAGTQSADSSGHYRSDAAKARDGRISPEEQAAAEKAGDPYVCQTEADATTRVRKYKICKHKSEWDAISEQHQREMEGMRKTNINPCSDNVCPGR